MPVNGFAARALKVFADDDMCRLHERTLEVLATIGVRVDSDEALGLLSDYGVRCDWQQFRAYPEAEAVSRALASVTRRYQVHPRRDGAPALAIGDGATWLVSGGAALRVYDGGSYRDATMPDVAAMAVLHEQLEHIHILINTVDPVEVKGTNLYPRIAAEMFCHATKPLLLQVGGRRDLERIIRLAELAVGGAAALRARPTFLTGINSEPPLHVTRDGAEVLITAARAGVPVSLGAYVMAGATGPLDVAGSIVQRTATMLTGLVLTQAAAPGSVYDFTAQSGTCDLRTGDVVTMGPQAMLLTAGAVQMGRHYGLVTHSLSATDARHPDAQAAGERFFSLTVSALAGAAVIGHATSCMAGMELADYAQCVLDNEIAGYVLDFAAGAGLSGIDASLAALRDVAKDPQYTGLCYLGHAHTVARCHAAGYRPDLFATGSLSRARATPRPQLYALAEERVRDLLAQRPLVVPVDLARELRRVAAED